MFENFNAFQNFAELNDELNRVISTLNRRGVASVNGLIDIDIPYTVNGVSGMASVFRVREEWTFTTEI